MGNNHPNPFRWWWLFVPLLCSCKETFQPHQVYPVEEGQLYRSGFLKPEELEKAVLDLKIKTVINLRGVQPKEDWFQKEFRLLEKLNVLLVSMNYDKTQIPHRRYVNALIDLFYDMEYPALIHCDDGVNRTGEAAAIYQLTRQRRTKEEALIMLSEQYGYGSNKTSEPSKKYFIEKIWQDESWVRTVYNPCAENYSYYNKNQAECGVD